MYLDTNKGDYIGMGYQTSVPEHEWKRKLYRKALSKRVREVERKKGKRQRSLVLPHSSHSL
jgi:hypothetical protein